MHRWSVGAGRDPDRYAMRPVPFHGGRVICVYNDKIRLASFPGLGMAVRLGVRRLVRMSGRCRVSVGE